MKPCKSSHSNTKSANIFGVNRLFFVLLFALWLATNALNAFGKVEPIGNLVIIDWGDRNQPTSKIHTKIAGLEYDFKIYAKNGKIDSGIEKLQCNIFSNNDNLDIRTYGNYATSEISASSLWVFRFHIPDYATKISGNYKIQCFGSSKTGNPISGEATFFVAPYMYVFPKITAHSVAFSDDILLSSFEILKYNETKKSSYTKQNNKPILKISESLEVKLDNSMYALSAYIVPPPCRNGKQHCRLIDSAINKNNEFGSVKIDSKITALAIDASKTPPITKEAGSECAVNISKKGIESLSVFFSKTYLEEEGLINDSYERHFEIIDAPKLLLEAKADNAILAQVEIDFRYEALHAKIQEQEKLGLCDSKSNKFPCPYPSRLKGVFEYQVVPSAFKVDWLDSNNNPLKTLHFGQESATTKLRITALKNNDLQNPKIATTFSKNCASLNTLLNNPKMQGYDFFIGLNSGDDIVIKGDDFKKGVANVKSLTQVRKVDSIPFTPNMKSEPAFTDIAYPNGFQTTMQFLNHANFPKYITNINNTPLIFRTRINAIDTDNLPDFGVANPTKVYYEFQCEYCNLDKISQITGHNYTNADRSPTQQGWWIDRTFGNQTKISKNDISIESMDDSPIEGISEVVNGVQEISYKPLPIGTYKLNILHGTANLPNFLLYNAYWNPNIKGHTSSFIYIKGKAPDNKRNYGIDTDGAKNTRSSNRVGKF